MTKPASSSRPRVKNNRHKIHQVVRSDVDNSSVKPENGVNLARERARACVFQDRFETLIDNDSNASARLEEKKEFVVTEDSSVMSERLMLLNVVGREATAIKDALKIVRKIADVLGTDQPSFVQTLGMHLQY